MIVKLTRAQKRTLHRRAMARRVRRLLRKRGCQTCPEHDPDVLDWDHVRGVKRDSVSRLVHRSYPWSTIEAEIAKCEVHCSNCHRRRHSRKRKSEKKLRKRLESKAGLASARLKVRSPRRRRR